LPLEAPGISTSSLITGPQAGFNPGVQTFVNGTAMSPVEIATSSAATDTVQ
jgi:hypothetical protein